MPWASISSGFGPVTKGVRCPFFALSGFAGQAGVGCQELISIFLLLIRFTEGTLPNGLAFAENGDILISNFGTDVLEVMSRDGQTKLLYDRIDGEPIGKYSGRPNWVHTAFRTASPLIPTAISGARW